MSHVTLAWGQELVGKPACTVREHGARTDTALDVGNGNVRC